MYNPYAVALARLVLESRRADIRTAMIRADRRDSNVMANAEADRNDTAKLRPRERVLLDLHDLNLFDRHRFPHWNAV